jgi:hypothetical protein
VPITASTPCRADTQWSSVTGYCITGEIPALSSPSDYDNNWGIMVGVNATADEPTDPIGQPFSWIALGISGSPIDGLRAVVHRHGDPAETLYCFDGVASGEQLPITKFNTACWDNGGRSLTVSDSAQIDKIGLWVPSGSAPITVSNLCLNSIDLGFVSSTATATSTGTIATSQAVLSFSPSKVDLGRVAIDATKSGSLVLSNTGNDPATDLTIAATGADLYVDARITTCKTTLDAGASCVVGYLFAPKTQGDKLTKIKASATGTSAVAVVAATAPAPASLAISPTTAKIASDVGVESSASTLTVTNVGETATRDLEASISGAGEYSFWVTTNTCTRLEPHAYCTIGVVFKAAISGVKTAQLTITDSFVSASVNLTGVAVAP